ncbi:LLM class flavin-dependent oxidoreductase, partial [uncultured Lentibacter sp.]|uniref:LLM class flavin-dependent oxidoreductase n=1 Tax=uncultured Lentibacter sp. TaxID=1659309 RepID=UPI00262A8051
MSMSAIFIGHESLTRSCAELWLKAGHDIACLVSEVPALRSWASAQKLPVLDPGAGLAHRLRNHSADWLLSVANLELLPEAVLGLPRRGCVNFHDGPLPEYAGLNTPVWARLRGERQHAISWHFVQPQVDAGDVILQMPFDISPQDTALTLNTKAYESALSSFPQLMRCLAQPQVPRQPQALGARQYFGKFKRPDAFGTIDFEHPPEEIIALVLGLDHGPYWNPLTVARIAHKGRVIAVKEARVSERARGQELAGTVLEVGEQSLTVASAGAPVVLSGLSDLAGKPLVLSELFAPSEQIAPLDAAARARLSQMQDKTARAEGHWRKALAEYAPLRLALAPATGALAIKRLPLSLPADLPWPEAMRRFAGVFQGLASAPEQADLAFVAYAGAELSGHVSGWVPLRFGPGFEVQLQRAREDGVFALDLPMRAPEIAALSKPDVALYEAEIEHDLCALNICKDYISYDSSRLSEAGAQLWRARLEHIAAQAHLDDDLGRWPLVPQAEKNQVLEAYNRTQAALPATTVQACFEAQVARTPSAIALIYEDQQLSYEALNARANQAAAVLLEMGVGPGVLVGLSLRRGPLLLVGALAILKAGGAYVPMDPTYPAERLALYLSDSAAAVVVTEEAVLGQLPQSAAHVLLLDQDSRLASAATCNPEERAGPEDLAYMIYTSGSTGRPKGVLVTHRNVSNFFTGMDARVPLASDSTWLAVTSLSFDISVLELFYTLARGARVVLAGDARKDLVSQGRLPVTGRGMDFGLFYWGNDDGPGKQKYRLLLEGAKFADANGFCAIWTPERHFHAFGGPYPNPAVTGAAVAAVTKSIAVRSGSVVAPLHHPPRMAAA